MRVTWRAPGRVNLIGEHTDYNEGLALPFAIEQSCIATVTVTGTSYVASSEQLADTASLDRRAITELPASGAGSWAAYALGPVSALLDRGYDVPPLRIHVDSDVPIGAGLSSSGALVCAVTCALDDVLGLELGPESLLALSREVEHHAVGAPTGGLDQVAALRCRTGHALLCDFLDDSVEQVRFDPTTHGLEVLVVDTRAPHQLADGQYAARRDACARAAETLGVKSLRDVSDLSWAMSALDDDELRRCTRHVVTENDRVRTTVGLLRSGAVEELGPVLSASHASLRDDYRVSVPQLDVAVETLESAGALGARVTGGGFGGSVLALVRRNDVDRAVSAVETAFADHDWTPPEAFTVQPAEGARRL